MARKNRVRNTRANGNRFRMTPCAICGEAVSDRKSFAIPNEKTPSNVALKRMHRPGVGCRAPGEKHSASDD